MGRSRPTTTSGGSYGSSLARQADDRTPAVRAGISDSRTKPANRCLRALDWPATGSTVSADRRAPLDMLGTPATLKLAAQIMFQKNNGHPSRATVVSGGSPSAREQHRTLRTEYGEGGETSDKQQRTWLAAIMFVAIGDSRVAWSYVASDRVGLGRGRLQQSRCPVGQSWRLQARRADTATSCRR